MIDWYTVSLNAAWVTGLSIVVAAFSYHDWVARETKRKRRDLFKERSWRLPWSTGMGLACVGWGLSQASAGWERSAWLVLGGWFTWKLIALLASQDAYSKGKRRPEQ